MCKKISNDNVPKFYPYAHWRLMHPVNRWRNKHIPREHCTARATVVDKLEDEEDD